MGNPRKSSPQTPGWAQALLWAALLLLWKPPRLRADCPQEAVQVVSVRKYYTLFLSSGQNGIGAGEPLLREVFLYRYRNFGPTCAHPVGTEELPEQPYLEFRKSIDGRPVPVQKIFHTYWINVIFPGDQEIEERTDTLQRVLPKDPRGKIDFFEDGMELAGFRPPIHDYWTVVDLGRMYTSFRQTPAFGLRSTPVPTFPQFLANQVVQVLPAGYRIQGSTVWWHWKQIFDPSWAETLHVEWRAWYR